MTAVAVTPARVLRSEWRKLATLRSTVAGFAAAVALMLGVGVLVCVITVSDWSAMSQAERDELQVGGRVLSGRLFAQLTVGIVGVLAVTGEYATGTIRSTLAAVPRRHFVLWAKLAVFAGVTLFLMTAASFASFFAGNAILAAHWDFSLSDPGTLRVVAMNGVTLAIVCVLGTALGFVFRSTASAIAVLVAVLLVLPVLGEFAPEVAQYLPSGALGALVTPTPEPNVLAPWPGFLLVCAYVVAAVAAAAVTLLRTEA